MKIAGILQFLHLLFAFSFVGSLVVAEWNSRAARATLDWAQRATLFQIIYLSSRIAGAGSLFVTGILGHAAATFAGYKMSQEPWMWIVTALWLLTLALMFFVNVPLAMQLASLARAAAGGGSGDGWDRTFGRWRFANVVQSLLYMAMLALMVFRWRA